MSDQSHTRDAGAPEDDFEWVNAWATSMRPAAPAAPPSGQRGADVVAEIRNRARAESAATSRNAGASRARKTEPAPSVARNTDDHTATASDGDAAIATLAAES